MRHFCFYRSKIIRHDGRFYVKLVGIQEIPKTVVLSGLYWKHSVQSSPVSSAVLLNEMGKYR